MDILDKIEGLEAKFHEVGLLITDPNVIADQARYIRLNREYHDLERVLAAADKFKKAATALDEAKLLLYGDDPELREMARMEIDELEPTLPKLEQDLKLMLIPQDKEDVTSITFEPWHYRYVGRYHAKIMHDNGLCLEEYIARISN